MAYSNHTGTATAVLPLSAVLLLAFFLLFQPAAASVISEDHSLLWRKFAANEDYWNRPAALFPYQDCFEKAARKYDLPLNLLLAVARGESDFNPRARSSADCYGIMQIKWPITARPLGFSSPDQLYRPCDNIMAGACYLRKMMNLHNNDIHLALAAYNRGPGRIPAGTSPGALPDKAREYSGYIYHHLKKIAGPERLKTGRPDQLGTSAEYRAEGKAPVISFQAPYRASGFIDHIARYAPDVRLDWFRNYRDEFCVVLLFSSDRELQQASHALEKAGYEIDSERIYR